MGMSRNSSQVPLLDLEENNEDDAELNSSSFLYDPKESGITQRKNCPKARRICMKLGNVDELVGSSARDHLANERTFLAWLRTAVSTIGLGVAIAKFGNEEKSKEAGLIFIFLGSVFLVYSTMRYYYLYFLLKRGLFAPNALGLVFVLILCFLAAAGTAAIVFFS